MVESSSDQDLVPVDQERFQKLKVKQECQLNDLVENEYGLTYERGCAFYEFSHESEDINNDKEVILMHKVSP